MHQLSFWPLVALVTGNLVGSGVFLLPATLAPFGTISIFGWMMTSIGAILLALLFGQLCSKFPRTGGPHVYIEEAFGQNAGYFAAWGYWVLSWISNAGLVVAAVGYLAPLMGELSLFQTLILEIAIILVLTAVNLRSIVFAGAIEMALTFIKLVPLIVIPLMGLMWLQVDHFLPLNPTNQSFFGAVNGAALLTIWGYIGLETGTVPSGDVKNNRRTVPRAIVTGTLIAAVIYMLGTVSILGALPSHQLMNSTAPYADLAQVIFGGNWHKFIAALAIVCCLGALNGWILVVGRIALGAAQDGLFPKLFAKTTKEGAPKWGLILSSCCSTPFVIMTLRRDLVQQFNFIVDVSVALVMLIYLACVLAYIKFSYQDPQTTKRHWILAIASLLFSIWILSAVNASMFLYAMTIMVLGIPMYLYQRHAFCDHKRVA